MPSLPSLHLSIAPLTNGIERLPATIIKNHNLSAPSQVASWQI